MGAANGNADANNASGTSSHENNGMATAFASGENMGSKPNSAIVATPPSSVARPLRGYRDAQLVPPR